MNRIDFMVFYTIFLMFVVYVSTLAGYTIFKNTEGLVNVPSNFGEFNPLGILNPLNTIQFFIALLTISTEYQILFSIVVTPFLVGMVWIIVSYIRGI